MYYILEIVIDLGENSDLKCIKVFVKFKTFGGEIYN